MYFSVHALAKIWSNILPKYLLTSCWLPLWLFQVCGLNTVKEISGAVTLPLKCCSLCRLEQKAFFQIHNTHECCMPQDLRGSLAWQVIWLVGLVFFPIE